MHKRLLLLAAAAVLLACSAAAQPTTAAPSTPVNALVIGTPRYLSPAGRGLLQLATIVTAHQAGTGTLLAPTGWTLVGRTPIIGPTDVVMISTYWHEYAESDPGSYTWKLSVATSTAAMCGSISGLGRAVISGFSGTGGLSLPGGFAPVPNGGAFAIFAADGAVGFRTPPGWTLVTLVSSGLAMLPSQGLFYLPPAPRATIPPAATAPTGGAPGPFVTAAQMVFVGRTNQ
jgi:hypothetical protein